MVCAVLLAAFLVTAFLMVVAKRISAVIRAFLLQSLCLFLYTLAVAVTMKHAELLVICLLILLLKVVIVPAVLSRIVRRIKVAEELEMAVNPLLSLLTAGLLTWLAYLFTHRLMSFGASLVSAAFTVAMATIGIGFFMMFSRMKALTQVLGLLTMENGIFLAAAAIAGGMPFFVEIALFFDIFIFVIISEIFVYKVNRLFTHIDISRMRSLKG